MDPAPHAPTAGQATVEYIAVIALVALLLVFAAPAVGGPDIPRAVLGKLRLGICVVAGDVCSSAEAKAAKLPPCTLDARTRGHAVSVTVFSIDLGGNETVTVAPQSDGTYLVSALAGVVGGASAGYGVDLNEGPVKFSLGASGAIDGRVQAGRGWSFPDAASAQRFVAALPGSAFDAKRWPPAWRSTDQSGEAWAGLGIGAGPGGEEDTAGDPEQSSAELAGVSISASRVIGVRAASDGTHTYYLRGSYEAEAYVPLIPAAGPGPHTYSVELSFLHGTATELVLRTASPSKAGNQMTDTVMHLDLTVPANRAAAEHLLHSPTRGAFDAVLARIHQAGLIETAVSEFNDTSYSATGALKVGVKFAGSYKKIAIRKHLVSATAEVAGRLRERYDCETRLASASG